MFLKCSVRKKDGKEHRSWSIVESRRVDRARTVHRHVLYLGELGDTQHRSWQKAMGVFDESTGAERQMVLFPEDRLPTLDGEVDAFARERLAPGASAPVGRVLAGELTLATTLRDMLGKVRSRHGAAERIWLMDRGIPTEEVLAEMRASTPPVQYLVGTPKGRLTRMESALAQKPWRSAREKVRVKLHDEGGEVAAAKPRCGAPRGPKDLAKFARQMSRGQRRALGIRRNRKREISAPSRSNRTGSGADYLLTVKGNQKGLRRTLRTRFAAATPAAFSPSTHDANVVCLDRRDESRPSGTSTDSHAGGNP